MHMCGMICVFLMCHPWTLFLQALGHFYKLGSIASLTPPLVMVITEEWANVIVFPFRTNQDLLANCVELGIQLFKGNKQINLDLLSFVLLFTCPSVSALTSIPFQTYGGMAVSKESLPCEIVTTDKLISSLQMENRELRKKLKKQQAQKVQKTRVTKKSSSKAKGKLLSRQNCLL